MTQSLHRQVVYGVVALFLLSAALLARAAAPENHAPIRVLLLHFSDLSLPLTVLQDEVVREALTDSLSGPIEFDSEGLDAVRLSGPSHEAEFVGLLAAKYAGRPPHLIVANGPTYGLLTRHRTELWPGTPLMLAGVDEDDRRDPQFPQDIPGTTVRFDLIGTVDLALRLQPEAHRVIVVTGSSDFNLKQARRASEKLEPYRRRLRVDVVSNQTVEELVRFVAALPSDTMIVFLGMSRDVSGRVYHGRDVVKTLAAASKVPIYGYTDTLLGRGIVGGAMQNVRGQSKALGETARRLLAGEPPSELSLGAPAPSVCAVDWRQLEHWGISQSLVPEDCKVLFRAPTLWERYGAQAFGIAMVFLALAALIIALLAQRHRRQAAELDAQEQRHELAHSARLATIGELSASIAHELNQPLTAIRANAEAGELLLKSGHASQEEMKALLADIRKDDDRASQVIERMRALLRKRPLELQPLNVNDAAEGILRLLSGVMRSREITVTTELGASLPSVKADRLQLEQVLLNLVMNAIDAMADTPTADRHLTVRTAENPTGSVEVSVSDSGPGIQQDRLARLFDPFFSTKRDGMGLGLSIARSIVQIHGGRIWAESSPSGATFRFTLPAIGAH